MSWQEMLPLLHDPFSYVLISLIIASAVTEKWFHFSSYQRRSAVAFALVTAIFAKELRFTGFSMFVVTLLVFVGVLNLHYKKQ